MAKPSEGDSADWPAIGQGARQHRAQSISLLTVFDAMRANEMENVRGDGDRYIYVWAALAAAAIAVTGFARTYYLKGAFAGAPLPLLLHIHGAVMTLWCILFIAQTCLVAGHRVDLHRRLGAFGVALAILVVGIGTYAALAATASEVRRHVIGRFHFLLGFNLVNLLLFAALVSIGLAFRRRPEFHKRLMLLAMVLARDA